GGCRAAHSLQRLRAADAKVVVGRAAVAVVTKQLRVELKEPARKQIPQVVAAELKLQPALADQGQQGATALAPAGQAAGAQGRLVDGGVDEDGVEAVTRGPADPPLGFGEKVVVADHQAAPRDGRAIRYAARRQPDAAQAGDVSLAGRGPAAAERLEQI